MLPVLYLGHFSYFLLVFTFLVSINILVWILKYKVLIKHVKVLYLCTFISLIVGSLWDIFAVQAKIWRFYEETTIGIFFVSLPIEEYLFILSGAFAAGSITIILIDKK